EPPWQSPTGSERKRLSAVRDHGAVGQFSAIPGGEHLRPASGGKPLAVELCVEIGRACAAAAARRPVPGQERGRLAAPAEEAGPVPGGKRRRLVEGEQRAPTRHAAPTAGGNRTSPP